MGEAQGESLLHTFSAYATLLIFIPPSSQIRDPLVNLSLTRTSYTPLTIQIFILSICIVCPLLPLLLKKLFVIQILAPSPHAVTAPTTAIIEDGVPG
jgi:hypothetical protein